MRKIITVLLAATALAGLAAQPASADDPQATVYTTEGRWGWSRTQVCYTPSREGVVGQYGAWGAYHDGCTVRLRCEWSAGCSVDPGYGQLERDADYYNPVPAYYEQTCNVRLRVFNRYGTLRWHRDGSNYTLGEQKCIAEPIPGSSGASVKIQYGDLVTLQANGVRSTHPGTASVMAQIRLFENRMS